MSAMRGTQRNSARQATLYRRRREPECLERSYRARRGWASASTGLLGKRCVYVCRWLARRLASCQRLCKTIPVARSPQWGSNRSQNRIISRTLHLKRTRQRGRGLTTQPLVRIVLSGDLIIRNGGHVQVHHRERMLQSKQTRCQLDCGESTFDRLGAFRKLYSLTLSPNVKCESNLRYQRRLHQICRF